MSGEAMPARIATRLSAFGLNITGGVVDSMAIYLRLLGRWNARMNLTSLPVSDPIPDSTIDKLIVESVCAAALVPDDSAIWLDLGSGGGSPAIPIRLCHAGGMLTMVESRERKCAFLREAVRTLELPRTSVAASRFEDFGAPQLADLLTIRAVRIDAEMVDRICRWSQPEAVLMCFGGSLEDSRFQLLASRGLPDGSQLRVFQRQA